MLLAAKVFSTFVLSFPNFQLADQLNGKFPFLAYINRIIIYTPINFVTLSRDASYPEGADKAVPFIRRRT